MNDKIRIEMKPNEDGTEIALILTGSEPITVGELEDVIVQFLATLPSDDELPPDAA